MHISPPQDAGHIRWFMFIPDVAVLAIPAWVTDRVGYARNSGATLVRRGNEVVWRRDQASVRGRLAVVR